VALLVEDNALPLETQKCSTSSPSKAMGIAHREAFDMVASPPPTQTYDLNLSNINNNNNRLLVSRPADSVQLVRLIATRFGDPGSAGEHRISEHLSDRY
jgi:hypothetical protein